jgi:UDP-N-acetylmuramate dehydrogenase
MKVSCRLYVEVTEPKDLLTLDFDALPQPLFVMGGGSNLLFTRDFPGTVLHMSNRGMRFLDSACGSARNDRKQVLPTTAEDGATVLSTKAGGRAEKSVRVTVAAGVVFDDFCALAAAEGLWGPENLSLIPGEVGASAVQNIGAYGVEAKDIIDTVHAFDLTTRTFVDIPCADCAYGYRTSRFKTERKGRYIITAVTFRLSAVPQPRLDYGGVRKALEARFLDSACGSARNDKKQDLPTKVEGRAEKSLTPQMVRETVIAIREQKLPDPAKIGSAGSFFCNPVIERAHFERIVATAREDNGPDYEVPHYEVGDRVKVPAAWMIDQCGFKGAREGGAQVYPKQPLVIVNATGDATPEEIITLERRVIDTIRGKYGVQLHPEVEHVAMQEAENQRDR